VLDQGHFTLTYDDVVKILKGEEDGTSGD